MNPDHTFKIFEQFQGDEGSDGPPHGFRGEFSGRSQTPAIPAALSIAVSRQAGARGGTLGKRVARQLGWEVYSQELLEYILREENVRKEMQDRLDSDASAWVEEQLEILQRERNLIQDPDIIELARIILVIGAKGQAVFIGRGAGHLLPHESTLHIRVIAPQADRVAYLAQWLRLTHEEASDLVSSRDQNRKDFLARQFHHDESDLTEYDLVINSQLLGEETCAGLIVRAAQAKTLALTNSLADLEEQ
jgi:cytidylate kinase